MKILVIKARFSRTW